MTTPFYITDTQFQAIADARPAPGGNYEAMYRLIYEAVQGASAVNGSSADGAVQAWFGAAAEANSGVGAASTLIRNYTQAQIEIRAGEAISGFDTMIQNASNKIAQAVYDDILGHDVVIDGELYYEIPDAVSIGQTDGTQAILSLNADIPSLDIGTEVWSGNPLYLGLGSDKFWKEELLNDTSNTYDVFVAFQAFKVAGISASLSEIFDLFVQFASGVPLEGVSASLSANSATQDFLNEAYGLGGFSFETIVSSNLAMGSEGDDFAIESNGFSDDTFMHGAGGNDLLVGSNGFDILDGGADDDEVSFHDASTNYTSTPLDLHAYIDSRVSDVQFSAVVTGDDIASHIYDVETLSLGQGDDVLHIDELIATTTSLTDVNAAGNGDLGDTIDVSGADFGATVSLDGNSVSLDDSTTSLNVTNFENVIGSDHSDDIKGDDPADEGATDGNVIEGRLGDDEIDGLGGNDLLRGMGDNDTIRAGLGADIVEGGSGIDAIYGGREGGDKLYGQGDNDTIYLVDASASPLEAGVVEKGSEAYGGSGWDTLDARGSEGAHTLSGGSGNDILYGNGNSTLSGGTGADIFYVRDGDTVTDPETADELWFFDETTQEYVHINEENEGVIFAGEYKDGGGVVAHWYKTDGRYTEISEGQEGVIVAFVATGVEADATGTISDVIYDMYIFNSRPTTLDPSSPLNISLPLNLSEAAVKIEGYHSGDFGSYDRGRWGSETDNLEFVANGFLTIRGYHGLIREFELENSITLNREAEPRTLSSQEADDEASFEKLTEALQDELTSSSAAVESAQGGDDDDFFRSDDSGGSFFGGGGNDIIVAVANANAIDGGSGDDLLIGGSGNDAIHGGAGSDIIYGDEASGTASLFDTDETPIASQTYDDEIFGGDGNDIIYAGKGNDVVNGGAQDDYLYGEAGNDFLDGGDGDDTAFGGVGNDTITGGTGNDTFLFFSGDGVDIITDLDPAADQIEIGGVVIDDFNALPTGVTGATVGTDFVLSYGSGDQITILTNTDLEAAYPDLFGEQSDGIVTGTGSADVIDGSFVDADGDVIDDLGQTINAGAGGDTIVAGAGDDTVIGGTDNDTLTGGAGLDTFTFVAGDGDDTITDFDPAEDVISIDAVVISDLSALPAGVTGATVGTDFVLSYGSGDQITIVTSTDLETTYPDLFGEQSDGIVTGTGSADVIDGSFIDADGDVIDDLGQTIDAGAGDDTVVAGVGNDTIVGGTDNDTLSGGAGLDTFTFASGDGGDTITDFDPAEDVISIDAVVISDLSALPAGVTGATVGTDFVLSYGSGDQITIVTNTDLEAAYPDLFGEQSDGIVTGTSSADVIDGSFIDADGDVIDDLGQTIDAGAGDDTVVAGAGDDIVIGGTDNDTLTGGAGLDTFTFVAGDGGDTITDFDPAEDVISIDAVVISDLSALPAGVTGATVGTDLVLSYGSGDQITILTSTDLETTYPDLFGEQSDGIVTGTASGDVIDGSFIDADGDAIDDLGQTITGGNGLDSIFAGAGDDFIFGDNGNDTIDAAAGDDTIDGGSGRDTVTGGLGADVFVFEGSDLSKKWSSGVLVGGDVITDFTIGEDTIRIDVDGVDSFSDLSVWYSTPLDAMVINVTGTDDKGFIILNDLDSWSDINQNSADIFEFV
jgi:Ca2+-binding RTX toxin-like protein